jgi:hypothetical protein
MSIAIPHRSEVSNEIETYPSLFSAVSDVAKERSLCPTSFESSSSSCKVVDADLATTL